ncbi:TetR/AcrR family transcriptional regulator [Gordonia sp. DT30]|uniref:TetR/AcrR family transcriptional regulator n=1 Tax=Gordonia sp. DT30 TaxID=3416546 RepID=UPI003CF24525
MAQQAPKSSAPKLTTEAIVDAAIDVADRHGLDALSMRRIADELGVGAMSLYRHIADKDALLTAMAQEVGRRFPYPVGDASPGWRHRITRAAAIDWELYQRHPWVVLAYAVPRYGFGDVSLAGLEWLAEGFGELGVDDARAVEMVLTFWSYVNGVALVSVSEHIMPADSAGPEPGGGLGELLGGWTDAERDARAEQWPILASLAGRDDIGARMAPRAILDAGVADLCAGFEAAAGG